MGRISGALDAQAGSSLAVAYMAYSAKEIVLSWKADKVLSCLIGEELKTARSFTHHGSYVSRYFGDCGVCGRKKKH